MAIYTEAHHSPITWTGSLPLIILGICTTLKEVKYSGSGYKHPLKLAHRFPKILDKKLCSNRHDQE